MGANNVGNEVGPIANLGIFPPAFLLVLGGITIGIGAITYGKKVADTVGKGITPLDIPGAFIAQLASALGMHLFSMLGIPVSTSSAIVGAVVGVGLVRGAKSISKNDHYNFGRVGINPDPGGHDRLFNLSGVENLVIISSNWQYIPF